MKDLFRGIGEIKMETKMKLKTADGTFEIELGNIFPRSTSIPENVEKRVMEVVKFEGLEDLTIEEVFYQIDDKDGLDCYGWEFFDKEFWTNTFKDDERGSAAEKAAHATYFGEVNWSDDFIRLDDLGNLETTSDIDFLGNAEEILERWLDEKGV